MKSLSISRGINGIKASRILNQQCSTISSRAAERRIGSVSASSNLWQSSTRTSTLPSTSATSFTIKRSFFGLPDLSKLSPLSQRSDNNQQSKAKGKSVTLKDASQLYTEEKVLPYSSSHLYSIVSDVDSYSEFLPYCLESKVLDSNPTSKEDESRTGIKTVEARLTVGFGAFKESYVSKVEMKEGEWVKASALPSNPIFKTLHTTWQFKPRSTSQSTSSFPSQRSNATSDVNQTQVSFSLNYHFSNPIYGAVASNTFESMAGKMMDAFEKRARDKWTSLDR